MSCPPSGSLLPWARMRQAAALTSWIWPLCASWTRLASAERWNSSRRATARRASSTAVRHHSPPTRMGEQRMPSGIELRRPASISMSLITARKKKAWKTISALAPTAPGRRR